MLSRSAAAAAWFGALVSCAERDAPEAATSSSDATAEWVLVFDDEFDARELDPTKWHARKREVRQKTTLNSASPEMASVDAGSLHLRAIPTPNDATFPFTAAYVDTEGLFAQTYGKVEFRLRGQFAPGLWYAAWGRPWTHAVPELDVEFLAENITQTWLVNHWDLPPIPADERRQYVTVNGTDIRSFHVYTIVWSPSSVDYQIDGRTHLHVEGRGVPQEPMFWILNTWVGGWAGEPTSQTIFPAEFEVDWFRVYRRREWLTDPIIRVAAPRPRYSAGDSIDLELADFDRGARVEVWEGEALLETLPSAPFRYPPGHLSRAAHTLRFVGTDGSRTASTSLQVEID